MRYLTALGALWLGLVLMPAAASAGWVALAPIESPRADLGAAALNGEVYVAGGRGLQGPSGSLQALHPRADLAAAALNGEIYAVGGRNSMAVDIYNTAKGAWRQGPALPSPRSGPAVAAVGGKIHVTGGQRVNPLKTYAEHLVLESGHW